MFRSFRGHLPVYHRPQKHWPEDRWASLARAINDRIELPLVLLGGPNDTAAARRFQDRIGAALYDFTGKTYLAEAAAIIARADLVIGVDTGHPSGHRFQVPDRGSVRRHLPLPENAKPQNGRRIQPSDLCSL